MTSPLIVNQKYFVNFKVSRIDRFGYCAQNKIGALFSMASYNLGNDSCNSLAGLLPQNFAHVYTNQIITDTANWATISGSFIADSAYQYIIIGNHFDNYNTDTMCFNSGLGGGGYYIDDVFVSTDSTVGFIQKKLENSVIVFPTVTDNKITVLLNTVYKADVKINDLCGRLVVKQALLPLSENEITLSAYNAGVYIITITIDNTQITKKIIISK